MKKFLVFSAILGAMVFAAPSIEAKTATAAAADPQVRVRVDQTRRGRRINNRWNNQRARRTVTTTRITRVGRYRYRETIRTTYLANGRTRTQVISRVRLVGGRRW